MSKPWINFKTHWRVCRIEMTGLWLLIRLYAHPVWLEIFEVNQLSVVVRNARTFQGFNSRTRIENLTYRCQVTRTVISGGSRIRPHLAGSVCTEWITIFRKTRIVDHKVGFFGLVCWQTSNSLEILMLISVEMIRCGEKCMQICKLGYIHPENPRVGQIFVSSNLRVIAATPTYQIISTQCCGRSSVNVDENGWLTYWIQTEIERVWWVYRLWLICG